MTCSNCDLSKPSPGMVIRTDDLGQCSFCGEPVLPKYKNLDLSKWDKYFHNICEAISSKSPCLSRKIGAILVRDKSIISTGYNGPARGIPHCGVDRIKSDNLLRSELEAKDNPNGYTHYTLCPRRALNYQSGEGMEWCPAQHAEENCISNAARNGVSTIGSTLYMNTVIPCKNCLSSLINAGITHMVLDSLDTYDPYSKFILTNCDITIRKFKF